MQRIVIYQVLPRLFGNDSAAHRPNGSRAENGCGRLKDFTRKALDEIHRLGITHVWYTGVIAHANESTPAPTKGRAGSPYAITDYYGVDCDLAATANPDHEFQLLVKRTHEAGMRVVIDFVPNHVARYYRSETAPEGVEDFGARDDRTQAFSPQNNFYYVPGEELHLPVNVEGFSETPARATGNDVFHAWPQQNDWYETVKLNYGVDYVGGRTTHFHPIPDTWNKMLSILLYWAGMGVDGFRCDMAEMVPVDFWEWAIAQVKARHPEIIFIAEVYNPAEYRNYVRRGGFDYLYDKVGLYDTLRAVACGMASTHDITRCWQSVDDIRGQMLNFLENHDEQRVASEFFAGNAERGKAALLVSALQFTNPFMLYFGQELGERGMDEEGFSGRDGRTSIFDYWSVDTVRRWRSKGTFDGKQLTEDERRLQEYYRRVLSLCNENEVLREGTFYDLMYVNPHLSRQYAFVRERKGEVVIVVANFDDAAQEVSINIPEHLFELYSLSPTAKKTQATDLLTGTATAVTFSPTKPLVCHVPPLGGVVLTMKCRRK